MAQPHGHEALACLSLLLLLLPGATTATSYSSLCRTPAPKFDLPAGHRSRVQPNALPGIYTGYFSGGRNLHFTPDRPGIPRSLFFSVRRSAPTTDPAVLHLFATLTLEGTHQRLDGRPHSVSFDLEGYYSATSSPESELCMVGSGSYAREDGFGVVVLTDVVLRLHVPRPSNLSRPFVTGGLEGAEFDAVTLVAYYAGSDYKYGEAASCPPAPPAPVRVPRQLRHARFSCYRLKALLRGSYNLEYESGGQAASRSPLLPHQEALNFNQMHCDSNGKLRAYMVFQGLAHLNSNYTVPLRHGFLVGEEALVAEGFWNTFRSQLCLRACRVVRSGPSLADLAVHQCGIGVSLRFPTVWSIWDRSVAAGMIWNTSRASDGDTGKTSGAISVSRSSSYGDDLSYILYNYTLVEKAKKHYLSMPVLTKERNGRFPGNFSYRDFAFDFYLKNHEFFGYASPVSIGSALVQGDRLMAEYAFYNNRTRNAEKIAQRQRLLNISYDLQYYSGYLNSSSDISQKWMSRQHRISAEGVYDTETGSLCMVACQVIKNGSSDCEILVTAQFASAGAETRERVVGTIRSLRKHGDPLFFEAQDFVAKGMYAMQIAEAVSRMDVEGIMLVVSMTMSCVFTALQLFHVKKHPEALPATSITMLVVLAVGYAVPLVLNLEAMFTDADRREKHFVQLTSAGLLELNEFMLRVSSMLAFVLQLRLLQLALSSRRTAEAGGNQADAAERSALWICLPLYLLGAVLVWIVHKSDSDVSDRWNNRARASLVDDLAGYAGLILDGFLLPQVVGNAFAGSTARALSPWFYAGGAVVRALPHVYDAFRRLNYVPSWASSDVYASRRDDLFGMAWDVAVPCGAAVLAVLVFLQQRLGGAFLCGGRGRRPGEYEMVSTLSS